MENKRVTLLNAILLTLLPVAAFSQAKNSEHTAKTLMRDVLITIVRLAQRERFPAGVLISREGYCSIAPSAISNLDTGMNAKQALEAVASGTGGSFSIENRVMKVRIGNPPQRLVDALQHRFPKFPELDGTGPYFSAILNGWLKSSQPGTKGFGIDIASSPGEEQLYLASSTNVSVEDVADKVALLSGGGIWIATDSEDRSSDPDKTLSISFIKYSSTEVTANGVCN